MDRTVFLGRVSIFRAAARIIGAFILLGLHPDASVEAQPPTPSPTPAVVFSDASVFNSNAGSDTGQDFGVKLITDGQGTWIAVWFVNDTAPAGSSDTDDIYYMRSTDNGDSWSDPALLSRPAGPGTGIGIDEFPEGATDGAGNWIVTWFSHDHLDAGLGDDEDILYVISTDNGLNWEAPMLLNVGGDSDSGIDDRHPEVQTDGEGNWLVIWSSVRSIGSAWVLELWVSKSTDVGETWSDPVQLHSSTQFGQDRHFRPKIRHVSGDHWFAAWHTINTLGGTLENDEDLLISHSLDVGETWSTPEPLSLQFASDSGDDHRIDVATDGQGQWVSVFNSSDTLGGTLGSDNDILVSRSSDSGMNWSDPEPLWPGFADDDVFDLNPRITTNRQGLWLTVWYTENTLGSSIGSELDIVFSASIDNGVTWSDPLPLNSTAQSDSAIDWEPHIAVGAQGRIIAAWQSQNDLGGTIGADADLFYSRDIFIAPMPTPTPTPSPPPPAVIGGNLDGQCHSGNRVLIKTEAIPQESAAQISQVLFEYRPAGVDPWIEILEANANRPNPDTTFPFFVHWDVTALADGNYDVRAVTTGLSGVVDPNPQFVTFAVAANCGNRHWLNAQGETEFVESVDRLIDNETTGAASEQSESALLVASIPSGALDSDTSIVMTFKRRDDFATTLDDFEDVGAFADLTLANGQTAFSGGKRATLSFTYDDADDDGFVDGLGIEESRLAIYWFDGLAWRRLDDSQVVANLNRCEATTEHFTLFAILAAAPAGPMVSSVPASSTWGVILLGLLLLGVGLVVLFRVRI